MTKSEARKKRRDAIHGNSLLTRTLAAKAPTAAAEQGDATSTVKVQLVTSPQRPRGSRKSIKPPAVLETPKEPAQARRQETDPEAQPLTREQFKKALEVASVAAEQETKREARRKRSAAIIQGNSLLATKTRSTGQAAAPVQQKTGRAGIRSVGQGNDFLQATLRASADREAGGDDDLVDNEPEGNDQMGEEEKEAWRATLPTTQCSRTEKTVNFFRSGAMEANWDEGNPCLTIGPEVSRLLDLAYKQKTLARPTEREVESKIVKSVCMNVPGLSEEDKSYQFLLTAVGSSEEEASHWALNCDSQLAQPAFAELRALGLSEEATQELFLHYQQGMFNDIISSGLVTNYNNPAYDDLQLFIKEKLKTSMPLSHLLGRIMDEHSIFKDTTLTEIQSWLRMGRAELEGAEGVEGDNQMGEEEEEEARRAALPTTQCSKTEKTVNFFRSGAMEVNWDEGNPCLTIGPEVTKLLNLAYQQNTLARPTEKEVAKKAVKSVCMVVPSLSEEDKSYRFLLTAVGSSGEEDPHWALNCGSQLINPAFAELRSLGLSVDAANRFISKYKEGLFNHIISSSGNVETGNPRYKYFEQDVQAELKTVMPLTYLLKSVIDQRSIFKDTTLVEVQNWLKPRMGGGGVSATEEPEASAAETSLPDFDWGESSELETAEMSNFGGGSRVSVASLLGLKRVGARGESRVHRIRKHLLNKLPSTQRRLRKAVERYTRRILRERPEAKDEDLKWHLCNPRYIYDWQCDRLVKMRGKLSSVLLAKHYAQAMDDYQRLLRGSEMMRRL